MTSYGHALGRTGSESIESTLRARRHWWTGALIRMSGVGSPKRITFENLGGAVRSRQCRKEKEWTGCVQSDIRAFGIAGEWNSTALEAEEWVETVTEVGRRFMSACRK